MTRLVSRSQNSHNVDADAFQCLTKSCKRMMYRESFCFLLIASSARSISAAFSNGGASPWIGNVRPQPCTFTPKVLLISCSRKPISESMLKSNIKYDDTSTASTSTQDYSSISISLPYAAAWIGFITFALFFTPEGLGGEASKELIEKFIQNPLNPGINHIFNFIFNLFAWIPFSLSALIMPGAKKQILPATPFLLGSTMIGYMSLGPYMSIRKPVTEVNRTELGWFTSNVLENKVVAWLLVLLSFSSIASTGLLSGLQSDFTGEIQGYEALLSSTALVSASSLDIVLLTITAASLIPEDLKRRGETDEAKMRLIALSTILIPVLGSVLYCALRPTIKDN